VPGQCDQVGAESIDHPDGRPQRVSGKVRVIVEIAKERDGEAIEARRPAPERDFLPYKTGTVRCKKDSVGSERSCCGSQGEADKFSSGRGKKRQSVLGLGLTEGGAAISDIQDNLYPSIPDR